MPTQTGSIDFKSTKGFQSYASGQYTTKTEIKPTVDYVSNAKANYGYQYKKDIVIYGESSKYYPVYFTNVGAIPQTVTHDIMIRREYSEQAPSDWNTSTHKGGLNIHFGWNFGGWGGATYKCEVYEFTQMYSTMVGDVLVGADAGMFSIVYLRGGGTTGALYHVYSDVPFTRHAYMTNAGVVGENDVPYIGLEQGVKYAQSTTGDNPTYKWNVRAPLTEPNTAHLNELYTVNRTALIESRVITTETAIEQTANNVLIKATQSDTTAAQGGQHLIESLINVAPSGVKIAASKVEIDGTAVFKAANAIPDTRSNNQPPSWYFTNYPKQSVTEFKTSSVMGLTGETYCYVTTVTGWADSSGGYPKQTAQIGSKTYWRVGVSSSAWSAWQETESTAGAQDKVNALEIGGRNFLRRTNTGFTWAVNTTTYTTHHLYSTGSSDLAYDGPKLADFGLKAGDEVTLSFDWSTVANGSNAIRYGTFWAEFYGVKTDGTNGYTAKFGPTITMSASNSSGHYVQTMVLTTLTVNTLRMVIRSDNSCLTFSISNAKLEKGNKATDWSPATEDVAASAVSRTQRIYYRALNPMTSWTMPTAWLTTTGDVFGQWTCKVPRMTVNADGTGTKYLYLYTCEQREMGDGTLAYTSVLLDDSTTVIDGGRIITGSVTANQIAAGTITGEQIAADTIEGGNIKGNAITAEHLSSAFSLDLGKVDGLNERLESIEGGISRLQDNTQWVHYDQTAGTVFGESGSANNVTVKGSGIDFNTDEGRAAWATGGVFHANEMEAETIDTQTITMGDWAIVQSGSTFYIDYIGS